MAIPDYQAFMLPLLKFIADLKEYWIREITQRLADHFGLTPEERDERLPNGGQTVVSNRVAWAKTFLKKAGLLNSPMRGKVQITEEGLKVLTEKPATIDKQFLMRYPSFVAFVKPAKAIGEIAPTAIGEIDPTAIGEIEPMDHEETKTPEEVIESAYQELRNALADDVLEQVKACSPTFFEHLVVRLLVAMGYGGNLRDAGQVVGKSGDGGIDGTIKEDVLGLDVVYIQAKKWEGPVSRPDVQKFAGSMEGFKARKGVFITTSSFSKGAEEYVTNIERKIVLIHGKQLAQLMIDNNIGVAPIPDGSYTIKRLDEDYFSDGL